MIMEVCAMSEGMDVVKREEQAPELTGQADVQVLTPMVDIYENEDEILLHADMPGVNREQMTINLDNDTLSLVGVRQVEAGGTARFQEFGNAEYRRSFTLPPGIDTDKVDAEFKDGVLRLHLPKSAAVKPRTIEVRQG